VVLAVFQVLAILSWAGYHEYVWATAPTFRIPLRPRDPFDLVRGRYFALNPLDATIAATSSLFPQADVERLVGSAGTFTGPVQVGFCPLDGVYRVCSLALLSETPAGTARYWSRGYAVISWGREHRTLTLDLGLRRFFIPNRLELPARESEVGWELEVSHRPGLTPLPRRLYFKGTPIGLR